MPEIFGHGAGVSLCYYSCCQHSSSQTHTGWSEVLIYWNNVFKIAEGAQPGALLLLLHVCFCKSGSSQWLCAATLIHDSPPAVRDRFTPFPNISCVAIETLIPVSEITLIFYTLLGNTDLTSDSFWAFDFLSAVIFVCLWTFPAPDVTNVALEDEPVCHGNDL